MLQPEGSPKGGVTECSPRVNTVTGLVQALDPGVDFARQVLVPALQQYQGFEGAMLLADRTVGVAFAITFWTSKEDMAASREDAQQLVALAAQAFHVQVDVSECSVAFSTFAALAPSE